MQVHQCWNLIGQYDPHEASRPITKWSRMEKWNCHTLKRPNWRFVPLENEENKKAINSGHIVQWEGTQAVRTKKQKGLVLYKKGYLDMMIDRAKNEKFINCLRNMNNYNSKVQNNHNIIKSTILSTMCLLRPLHSFPLSPVLVFIISSMLIIEVTSILIHLLPTLFLYTLLWRTLKDL